eukprot:tig00000492_g1410.t1
MAVWKDYRKLRAAVPPDLRGVFDGMMQRNNMKTMELDPLSEHPRGVRVVDASSIFGNETPSYYLSAPAWWAVPEDIGPIIYEPHVEQQAGVPPLGSQTDRLAVVVQNMSVSTMLLLRNNNNNNNNHRGGTNGTRSSPLRLSPQQVEDFWICMGGLFAIVLLAATAEGAPGSSGTIK